MATKLATMGTVTTWLRWTNLLCRSISVHKGLVMCMQIVVGRLQTIVTSGLKFFPFY